MEAQRINLVRGGECGCVRIGVGFSFMFLGILTTIEEIMGIAPDEAK